MKKLGIAFVGLLALSACTTTKYVVSDVTRFHELPGSGNGASFAIVPSDDDQQTSLAFKTFSDVVADALQARGLQAFSGDGSSPDYVVTFSYDVEGPSPDTYSRYGAGRYGFGYGFGYYGRYGGFGYGPGNDVRTKQIYIRRVDLDIFEGPSYGTDSAKRVFEGHAVSEGTTNQVEPVLPYMIQAIFRDFPGASGESVKVKVEVPPGTETASVPKARRSY